MTSEISYTTAMDVSSMWDTIKFMPDYEAQMGTLIFQYLFNISSNANEIFKLNDGSVDDISKHKNFKKHAHTIIDMIDCVIQFLGPNLDSLEDFLYDLGSRHVRYGAKPEDLKAMGQSVIFAVSTLKGAKFTPQDREDWNTVFDYLVEKMVQGLEG